MEDLVFFSTDVKSLYPSLQAKPCADIITRMLEESRLVVEGVNWDQAVYYLALTINRAKVEELGLGEVVPKWRKDRGRAPGITTKEVRAPLQEQKEWGKSLFFPPTRATTTDEKKRVLSLCVEQGLLAALDSHLYLWQENDEDGGVKQPGQIHQIQDGREEGGDLGGEVEEIKPLVW